MSDHSKSNGTADDFLDENASFLCSQPLSTGKFERTHTRTVFRRRLIGQRHFVGCVKRAEIELRCVGAEFFRKTRRFLGSEVCPRRRTTQGIRSA